MTMTTITSALLKPRAAVPVQALDKFRERARAAGLQAFASVVAAGGTALALYRRWDAHQERLIRQAAEGDNVHLLFPRV